MIIKSLMLLLVFVSSLFIGFLIAKKYENRVKELRDMKNALNIFETKIRFTYASIPEIFEEIAKQFEEDIVGQIFKLTSVLMKDKSAGESWNEGIDTVNSNMTLEDKSTLKNLGKLLGKTDVEGQISEIRLVTDLLNTQIELAEIDRRKNEKMYKTLGGIIGLTLVIIFVWGGCKMYGY